MSQPEHGPEESRLHIAGGIIRALAVCLFLYLLIYVVWALAS
jgi:hypothetical protein